MNHTVKRLSFGLTGQVSPATPVKQDPSFLLSHNEVQELLINIAEQPKSRNEIETSLEDLDIHVEDLQASGLIQQAGEFFRISFILFLKEDLKTIHHVTSELAQDLAKQFLSEGDTFINMLRETKNTNNNLMELAFILIGCFSLDWDGLQIANQLGYHSEPKPSELGDRYIPWAEERQPEEVKGLYWGSVNDYYTDCVLTSFGDHYALPRIALPDLSWRMERSIYDLHLDPSLEQNLVLAFSPYLTEFNRQIGRVMLAYRQGAQELGSLSEVIGTDPKYTPTLIGFLKAISYLEGDVQSGFKPIIPILPALDAGLVEEVLTHSGKILVEWLPDHVNEIERRLGNITPLKYELTFEEIFSQVWHYLLGYTNRYLVAGGLFANPYHPERKYQGFIPAVWHPDAMPEETTF